MSEKDVLDVSKIEKYIPDYDSSISMLDKEISNLNADLKTLTEDIDNTEKELDSKLNKVIESKKFEQDKIKTSENLTSEFLNEAAERLSKLDEEEKSIEKDVEEKKEEFSDKFNELKEKITLRNEVKSNIEKNKEETINEMKKIDDEYSKVFDRINSAIELCSNSKLKDALNEEKEEMISKLEDIKERKTTIMNDELSKINKKSSKKEEIIIKDNISEEKEDENINQLIEEIKKINISSIEDEEVKPIEIEVPDPIVNNEVTEDTISIDFELTDREVIQRDSVSEDKIEQIKNSNIISENIKDFFQKFNSGLLTAYDEGAKLKTIEDENVSNTSLEEQIKVGSKIKSITKIDVYNDLENLKVKFNPEKKNIISTISKIILMKDNEIINVSDKNDTILSEFKISSGIKDENVDIIFDLDNDEFIYFEENKINII